ncbi:hypothetical protein NE237_023013 [Protea cynaroides]|uniref:Uncharacterized protein n=1 Tax=Protea cynaroides TaxID=273540 RepID=A0A9Q0HC23_9MAGN|nr:hypothetical protein NE237_023013 [Protea cynaroides]
MEPSLSASSSREGPTATSGASGPPVLSSSKVMLSSSLDTAQEVLVINEEEDPSLQFDTQLTLVFLSAEPSSTGSMGVSSTTTVCSTVPMVSPGTGVIGPPVLEQELPNYPQATLPAFSDISSTCGVEIVVPSPLSGPERI